MGCGLENRIHSPLSECLCDVLLVLGVCVLGEGTCLLHDFLAGTSFQI
jgi:hypothetical protein